MTLPEKDQLIERLIVDRKAAADRIEELEKCILMARDKFHADISDIKAAVEMLRILNDVEILRLHGGAE
jgi:hypothetical protein